MEGNVTQRIKGHFCVLDKDEGLKGPNNTLALSIADEPVFCQRLSSFSAVVVASPHLKIDPPKNLTLSSLASDGFASRCFVSSYLVTSAKKEKNKKLQLCRQIENTSKTSTFPSFSPLFPLEPLLVIFFPFPFRCPLILPSSSKRTHAAIHTSLP